MTALLHSQPTNIVGLICMLVAHVSGRRRAKDPTEERQINKVLKALLRYGSTIAAQSTGQDPSFHALSELLRYLSSVEDENLFHTCINTWRLNCQTWDTMVPGCTSSLVDWLNFGDEVNMAYLPFEDPEIMFRQRLQDLEQRYGKYDPRCVGVFTFLLFYIVGYRARMGVEPFNNTVLELCEEALLRKAPNATHRIIILHFAAEACHRRGDTVQGEAYMRACVDAICKERGVQDLDDDSIAACLEDAIWNTGDCWRLMRYQRFQAGGGRYIMAKR